ncbi:uncharacterized protein LOC112457696 [Temnothorax curvispinosus]|uniref:Uncharacterized protein LOC112457696 n=1 Tax=Temnothorax curvispinosus TaxID=300111 RepID=A0A6J1Q5D7_9HYME|nr:uncharacterized protein LOC112457696 [Temnothorax curvispinosus]
MGLSVFLRLWLCYASKTLHNPTKRLYRFLSTLYACLSRSARAVLQFYPENDVAVDERELDGDLILGDIGQGLPFKAAATGPATTGRAATGPAAISVADPDNSNPKSAKSLSSSRSI